MYHKVFCIQNYVVVYRRDFIIHLFWRDSLELPSIRISHMPASFWSLPKLKTKTATARQLIEQRLELKVEIVWSLTKLKTRIYPCRHGWIFSFPLTRMTPETDTCLFSMLNNSNGHSFDMCITVPCDNDRARPWLHGHYNVGTACTIRLK